MGGVRGVKICSQDSQCLPSTLPNPRKHQSHSPERAQFKSPSFIQNLGEGLFQQDTVGRAGAHASCRCAEGRGLGAGASGSSSKHTLSSPLYSRPQNRRISDYITSKFLILIIFELQTDIMCSRSSLLSQNNFITDSTCFLYALVNVIP